MMTLKAGNSSRRGKLSTIYLLIKLPLLTEGGQPYWAFPFNKGSLPEGYADRQHNNNKPVTKHDDTWGREL